MKLGVELEPFCPWRDWNNSKTMAPQFWCSIWLNQKRIALGWLVKHMAMYSWWLNLWFNLSEFLMDPRGYVPISCDRLEGEETSPRSCEISPRMVWNKRSRSNTTLGVRRKKQDDLRLGGDDVWSGFFLWPEWKKNAVSSCSASLRCWRTNQSITGYTGQLACWAGDIIYI